MTRGKRPARSWGWIFAPGAILRRSRRRPCPRAVPPAASLPRPCRVRALSRPRPSMRSTPRPFNPATATPSPVASLRRPCRVRPFNRSTRPRDRSPVMVDRRRRQADVSPAVRENGYTSGLSLDTVHLPFCIHAPPVPAFHRHARRSGGAAFFDAPLAPVCRIWYHSRVPLPGLAR